MSESNLALQEAQFTQVLKTMGLEDTHVAEPRTITVGLGSDFFRRKPSELVQNLPRLMKQGERATAADLEFKDTLGQGGMGLVELAEQISLGRDVAVKKVRPDARSEEATLVLLREGWTTGILEHPNIVPIHTLGRDEDGEPIIVMKRISGVSWMEIIKDSSKVPPAFETEDPFDLYVEILSQICNAMHYAHSQGIIHRDLKPENVMLGEFGEVYVLDWGIALSLEPDPTGRLASIEEIDQPSGTPVYMAPEMVEGNGSELGIHTDIFLLGAMLHEALTGRPPHRGTTVFQILFQAHLCAPPVFDSSIPEELAMICQKAMSREPGQRYGSAREMREALLLYRKNRESYRLAAKGSEKLARLKILLHQSQSPSGIGTSTTEKSGQEVDGAKEQEIYQVFSECRFAFEQARQVNPALSAARRGLQEVLELMIRRELDRKAHKAAVLLLTDLPEPNEELSQQLQRLGEALRSQQADFETLQRFRFEADTEVGQGSRALFVLIMGISWSALSAIVSYLVEFQGLQITHERTFAHIVFLTALIGYVIYFGRERFFVNQVNRKILYAALATFVCVCFHRGLAWIQDVPFRTIVAHEMLMYGMGVIIAALFVDRRLIYAGVPFLIGAILGGIYPSMMYWMFVPTNLIGVIVAAWIWGPGRDRESVESIQ